MPANTIELKDAIIGGGHILRRIGSAYMGERSTRVAVVRKTRPGTERWTASLYDTDLDGRATSEREIEAESFRSAADAAGNFLWSRTPRSDSII